MTVVPLESLPLGFRFHPTDEELVNHYLKRKLNGRIRSEIEVIPEVDVCKCEPWDLPDKALIRSDDPEWFFFAPKDRKYPNGHRSNRATEAGYWKATGKDRCIRTKAPAAPGVIGMKKTLVFHRGRAPKGVRTHWIMHEYRATEPEYESGEGGYVLYRLFKKPEEKIPICNVEETDMSGLSPTTTKSSPNDTQHEADEEFGTPVMATPINQVSPLSDIQDDPQSLHTPGVNQPSGITRWLADKADCTSLKPEDGHCTTHMEVEQEVEAGAVVDTLLDALGPFYDRNDEQIHSNGFPTIPSPLRPYSNHPFFGSTDYSEHDYINEFLNSILITQEECSEGSRVQQMSTHEVIHSRSGSEIDNEVGLPQELFNSMQESNGHMNASSNGVNLEETGITSIKIRPRQPQHTALDNLSAQQGFARRRIHLQCSVQTGALSSSESESSIKKEDDEDREATVEVEENKVHDDIVNGKAIPVCPHIKLEDSSIHDDASSSSDIEDSCLSDITHESPRIKLEDLSIHDDTNSPSNTEGSCLSNINPESTHNLRLRIRSATETTVSDKHEEESALGPKTSDKLKEESALGPKTSRPDLAMGRGIFLVAIMVILTMVCFGIWRWIRSQSLWVSENSI